MVPILLRNALPAHHLPINLEDHHQAYNQGDSSTIDNLELVSEWRLGGHRKRSVNYQEAGPIAIT